MKTYYGIFYLEDGQYGVFFADSTFMTCGDTLDEALDMAIDGLSTMLGFGTKGLEFHDPLSYDEVLKSDTYKEIREKFEWVEVFPVIPDPLIVAMEKIEAKKREKAVACNLSIPQDVLKIIDTTAKTKGMTRSNFMIHSTLEAIQKERLTT